MIKRDWQPITYTSRDTPPAFEWKTLSVQFGCKRFLEIIYKHYFEVEKDYKFLLSILKKITYQNTTTHPEIHVDTTAVRLFSYIPEKDAVVPDECADRTLKKIEIYIKDVESLLHLINKLGLKTDKKFNIYCKKAAIDESLKLAKYTPYGWTEKQKIKASGKSF